MNSPTARDRAPTGFGERAGLGLYQHSGQQTHFPQRGLEPIWFGIPARGFRPAQPPDAVSSADVGNSRTACRVPNRRAHGPRGPQIGHTGSSFPVAWRPAASAAYGADFGGGRTPAGHRDQFRRSISSSLRIDHCYLGDIEPSPKDSADGQSFRCSARSDGDEQYLMNEWYVFLCHNNNAAGPADDQSVRRSIAKANASATRPPSPVSESDRP
jgi:hypothetical protein